MFPVEIVDGHGTSNRLKINGEGELTASIHSHPPIDEEVSAYPFSQFFTDDGTSSGSEDMRVDGSSTPQEFYITASAGNAIFIKTISILISDAGAALNEYANLAALTNGITWRYTTNKLGEVDLKAGIKTNLDFIRIGIDTPPIGSGSGSFLADLSGGGADSYLIVIDMTKTFGLPWGLKLEQDSKDKISFIVNDDLSTGISEHTIIGFGTIL